MINSEDIILEITLQPAVGSPSAIRVLGDGRHFYLSDQEIEIAAEGKAIFHQVSLDWRFVYAFTLSELDELRQAIRDANFSELKTYYVPSGVVHDGATITWKVWLDGKYWQIAVEGYPANTVTALEELYERFNQIHKRPHLSSIWRVWYEGQIVERTVDCDVSAVVEFRPLIRALFRPDELAKPDSDSPIQHFSKPDSNIPIIDIAWRENEYVIEKTCVYSDGHHIKIVGNQETLVKVFSTEQLAALLEIIHERTFASFPESFCS